jgi:tetratricopeptide (TPR) repeat protein
MAELTELTQVVGDPALSAWADQLEASLLILAGDVKGFETTLARVLAAVDGVGQPSLRWFAAYFRAALAFIRGDLDEAERLAAESAQVGNDAGQSDTLMIYAAQLGIVRSHQGRVQEILELIEQSVEANPGLPAWRAALALNYVYTGRLEEGEALLSEAVATHLDGIPYDQARTCALGYYAEVAFMTDHRPAAAILYEALEPWADEFVFTGASGYGHARMYLGMLASVLGDHELSDEQFGLACRLHDGEGIRLWGAHGRAFWAQALARRGEKDRAREQAELALAVAREHGYVLIEQFARRVLEPVAAE